MPQIKLSAILNNCPLHSLVPEIVGEINKFAINGAYNNNHNASYNDLKRHFALFYALPPEGFTWKQFAALLNEYNPFDTQLLLSPVLRSLLKTIMTPHEDTFVSALGNDFGSNEEYISASTELLPTGRYRSLSPDELFLFLAKPLGISILYHPQAGDSRGFDADANLATVSIYHQGNIEGAQAGGHWERVKDKADYIDYQKTGDTKLNFLTSILDEQTSSYGLELVKKHTQLTLHALSHGKESVLGEYASLEIAVEQINQYTFNIKSVPKELALKLMGKQELTPLTRAVIDKYEFVEVPKARIFENWLNARPDNKPPINKSEEKIIERLLIPLKREEALHLESERVEKEKAEKEQAAQQLRVEKERAEQVRREKERTEQLRIEKERTEQLRLEKEREAQQLRVEKERAEHLRREKERTEQLRIEKERTEQLRLEKEQDAQQLRVEKERADKVRQDQLLKESAGKRLLINSIKSKVKDAITSLENNIGLIDEHHTNKAFVEANILLNSLKLARDIYLRQLLDLNVDLKSAADSFKSSCKTAIDKATPTLKKDLGWQDIIKNLMKSLANAVIGLFTSNPHAFYAPAVAASIKAIRHTEISLEINTIRVN